MTQTSITETAAETKEPGAPSPALRAWARTCQRRADCISHWWRARRSAAAPCALFTSSPRQWSSNPIKDADIAAFRTAREETGIEIAVAHNSYLINLAAPTDEVLAKSQAAFRGELDRAEQLNLSWVVTHMGAHLDQGEDEAFERLIASLRHILEATDDAGYSVGIALETTAGQGTGLGWQFEQLGRVLQGVGDHPRLGICLDTCHIFVAGYDIRTEEAYEATLAEFDAKVGLRHLKVIHANDARKPLGSRVDRHEHIGQGEIGKEAFARIVTDPRLRAIPVIIETPELRHDARREPGAAAAHGGLQDPDVLRDGTSLRPLLGRSGRRPTGNHGPGGHDGARRRAAAVRARRAAGANRRALPVRRGRGVRRPRRAADVRLHGSRPASP